MHKIVALALINNGPYVLIEHLNDDKMDYRPENLKFSNQSINTKRAIINGNRVIQARVFTLELTNGLFFTGTMKEISKASGIPVGTIYDNLLYRSLESGETSSKTQSRSGIKSIVVVGQQTIEKVKLSRVG